jgi:glycosyltransferase involved in cell wall biosynthesis
MQPSVSVVIPNYNNGRFIQEALFSVSSENYANKQAIIIDDCSTDDSWSTICRLLQLKADSPSNKLLSSSYRGLAVLTYRKGTNEGPAAARNTGIKQLWNNTDAYLFLDADDIILEGKIRKSVEVFTEDPTHIGVVYSDYLTQNIITGVTLPEFKQPFSFKELTKDCILSVTSLVSKTALDKCGLFDESFRVAEDYDLWLRISTKFVITHIPEILWIYRVGNHNASIAINKNIWQEHWDRLTEKFSKSIKQ